jgi:hypothetical protein
MARCLLCLAPKINGACLCTGSERRALETQARTGWCGSADCDGRCAPGSGAVDAGARSGGTLTWQEAHELLKVKFPEPADD